MDFMELEELFRPVLEEYASSLGMTIDELLLDVVSLKDTKLFNVNDKNSIYYIFKKNKVSNLKKLFELYDSNSINDYNKDVYSKMEIDGIVMLLKYKYLSIIPCKLDSILSNMINSYNEVDIYKLFRMCGLNDFSSNMFVNFIRDNYLSDMSLGDFLYNLDMDMIKMNYGGNIDEYNLFINIRSLISDYQKEYLYKEKIVNHI